VRVVRIALAAGYLAAALAQEPAAVEKPPLENTGKPMTLPYQCTGDDIQTAGLSCTAADPCPIYLELSAVEAVGNRIFLAGNIHTPATTLYSVLLASDDAGKTWREPYPRLRAAGLDRIQFVDFENGWSSGEVLQPLPRDPFLLVTSDGGKAWRLQPIFSDSQYGSILQFWFNSRTRGSLLVDRGEAGGSSRYELYETANAGQSWTLKESSDRLPKLTHLGGTANADWRIRADAPSRSFHIERHSGERWHSLAAFAISLGRCTLPEKRPFPAP
jgi:hypothetical protein